MPRLVGGKVVYDTAPAAASLTTRYDEDQMTRRVKMIARAYPTLKKRPKLLANLANSDAADDELVQMVTRGSGFAQVQAEARKLRKMHVDEQAKLWDSYDKTHRSLLKGAGYQPSAKVKDWEPPDGNFGGDLLKIGKGALGAVMTPVSVPIQVIGKIAGHSVDLPDITDTFKGVGSMGTAIGRTGVVDATRDVASEHGLGFLSDAVTTGANAATDASNFVEQDVFEPVLGAMNTVSRFPGQLYRANQAMGGGKVGPTTGEDGPLGFIDAQFPVLSEGVRAVMGDDTAMRHFTNAWEDAANGERNFNNHSVAIADGFLNGNVNQLATAKAIAGGTSPDEIAAKYGEPGTKDYTDTYLELLGLQGQPRFQKAVAALSEGKVSPGRDLARSLGVYDTPYVGDIVSGAADAAFTWYSDPLIVAGAVHKAYRMKDVIRTGEDVQRIVSKEATVMEALDSGFHAEPITMNKINKYTRQAPHLMMNEELALKFRESVDEGGDALYRYFWANRPRFIRSIGSLLDFDARLADEKARELSVQLLDQGRVITEAEQAAVKGIEDGRDMARYFAEEEGVQAMLDGSWGYAGRGALFLPRRTMLGSKYGNLRELMKMHMDWYAEGDIHRLSANENVLKNADAMVEPELGTTRLYQVRLGRSRGPTDLRMPPQVAAQEWTTDLSHAEQSSIPLAEYGQVYAADVSDDVLKTWGVRYDDELEKAGVNVFLAPQPLEGTHLGPTGELAEVNGRVISRAERILFTPPARLIKMMTAKIPEKDWLSMHDHDLPRQLIAMLDMEYGGAAKADVFGQIMMAPNVAVRRQMIKSVVERMSWSNGLYETELGTEYARQFIMGIDQKYAANGRDIIHLGTKSTAEGTMLSDHADAIAIPDFRKMMAVSKRIGVLNGTLNGINASWVDAFIGSYWRPSMLLRLGFAPRGAADEFLTALFGAPEMFSRGAWLKLAKANGVPVASYRDMTNMSKLYQQYGGGLRGEAALKQLEDNIITLDQHWSDRVAHILFNRAHHSVGEFAMSRIDANFLDGALDMAKHPSLKTAFFDDMTKMGANAVSSGLVDDMTHRGDWVGILDREGDEVRLSNVPGEHQIYDGPFKAEMAAHQGSRQAVDPVIKHMGVAHDLHVTADEAHDVNQMLVDVGDPFANASFEDPFEAVSQLRDALKANPKFKAHYRTYLEHRNGAQPELADEALAKMSETSGDNDLLHALTNGAGHLNDDVSWMLRAHPDDALELLHRPPSPEDELHQAMYGPALYTQPDDYAAGLVANLPVPEPDTVRFYGKHLQPQLEANQNVAGEVARGRTGLSFENDDWREVSSDPAEVLDDMKTQASAAVGGTRGDMDSLFYIDLTPEELAGIDMSTTSKVWLPNSVRDRAERFGDDVGTQLDQIIAWSKDIDSIQLEQWNDLVRRASRGDAGAADELAIEIGLRQVNHPVNARIAKEMTRGNVHVDADGFGTPVLQPSREGRTPVYYLTFNPKEADTAFLHVDESNSTGRKFVAGRQDPGPAEQMIADGDGTRLFPISRWATTDPQEAEQLATQIEERAAAAQSPITVGISRLEADDKYVKQRFAQGDIGSHDYELRDGEGVMGKTIERTSRIERLAADDITKTREEIVKIHNDIRAQMRTNLLETPAAPSAEAVNDATYAQLDLKDPMFKRYLGSKNRDEVFDWVADVKTGNITVDEFGVELADKIDRLRATVRDSLLGYPERAAVEEATNREVAAILGSHPNVAEGEMQYAPGDLEAPVFDTAHERIAGMKLNADELEDMRRRWELYLPEQSAIDFARANPGKRMMGNGATLADAQRSQVETMNAVYRDLHKLGGRTVHEISQRGRESGRVDVGWYVNSPYGVPLPAQVVGPKRYVVDENWMNSVVRKGFDKFIAPLTNGLARRPRFYNNALKRYGETQSLLRPLLVDEEAQREVLKYAHRVGLSTPEEFYRTLHGTWDDIKATNVAAWESGRTPPGVLSQVEARVERGGLPEQWLRFSDEEWDTIHKFMRNESLVRERVADVAAEGALRDTIPFIDDSAVRSQFTDQIRNLSPFWWAQESFFRRWGRTIAHSPEAIRKAQLLVQGSRHVGVIEKDENGRDVFVIPGMVEVNEVLQKAAGFFGVDMPVVPIPVGVSGDLRLASPGFDQIGVPGMSPLVGVPIAAARIMFPENAMLRDTESGLMSERGAGRNPLEQFFPAWLVQAGKAIVFSDSNDEQVMSASIGAMQYLEANGHGLADDATATEREHYFDEVRRYARVMMGVRALTLFASPVSPSYHIEVGKIDKEYRKLLQNLPIEQATATFLELHPNAHAYTVFDTQTPSGATLPGTEKALEFMDANRGYLEANPLAGAWMLPQSSATDKFSRKAYEEQKQIGLREQKTPEEWYADFKFSQAAPEYFEARDDYERDRMGLRLPSSKRVLDETFAEWKDGYFKMHPLFASELQSRDGVQRREDTLAEMDKVLADPKAPAFEHREQMVTLVDAYHDFNSEMRALRGESGQRASDKRDRLRFAFWDWSKSYAMSNPSVLGFYQRVLDPMIGLSTVEREGLIR